MSGAWQTCATGLTATRLPFIEALRCAHWSAEGQQGSPGVQRQWECDGGWDRVRDEWRETRRDRQKGIFMFEDWEYIPR